MRTFLFVLTYFSILYVVIIEFLEECDHLHTWAVESIPLGESTVLLASAHSYPQGRKADLSESP
jgi:hypothetical protein